MLSQQNIEADLSYAYLHLIAARGGFSRTYTHRHLDDAGVDAIIYEDGRRLASDSLLTSLDVHVQLKATYQTPVEQDGHFSYSITVPRYDKLRRPQVNSPRILVVLYLPEDANEWLRHSEDCLVAKRCVYWVSSRNAPESANPKHQTVYVPRRQILSVERLTELMARFSRREEVAAVSERNNEVRPRRLPGSAESAGIQGSGDGSSAPMREVGSARRARGLLERSFS